MKPTLWLQMKLNCRICQKGAYGMFALALAMVLIPLGAVHAWAVDGAAEADRAVSAAQSSLQEAEANMAALVLESEALKTEINELQRQIDETTTRALEAQEGVIAGREALGKAAAYEYRTDSFSMTLTLLLESQDFNDLVRNLGYLDIIMQHQADEIAQQKERSVEFDKLTSSLNFQKDEQEKKLVALSEKRTQAEQVAASASASLQNAQDDQAARLAALKESANQLVVQEPTSEPGIDEGATTPDRGDVVGPSAPVTPNPDPAPPTPTPSPSPSPAPGVSWSTGVASAYGGSSDPYTPNPGITATGAVCDDYSMGVAVPMAWPRYWQYYGRTVEISYNGMTVFATVNDCGGMDGGKRVLDLQPGVWKAFGFSTCKAWGLRTVSYRFL